MIPSSFRIGSVLVLLLAAGLLIFGGTSVLAQHDRVTRFIPTPCKIERSELKVKRGRKSSTYTPIIEYSYDVDGVAYRGTSLLPASENWGRSSAREIVDRHPLGASAQAYFDPARPGQSFLVKRLSFQPYFFALLGGLIAAVGAALWFSGRRRPGHQQEAEPRHVDGADWWPLTPEHELDRRLAKWRWSSLTLIVLGAGPMHYLSNAGSDPGGFAIAATAVYSGAMLVCVACWIHAAALSRRYADPGVLIDRPDPMIGEEFTTRISVEFLKPTPNAQISAGLLCREAYREKRGGKTQYGERTCYQNWLEPEPTDDIGADGVLIVDRILAIPATRQPTTPPAPGATTYPNYTWLLGVKVKVRGGADLVSYFPIHIAPGAPSTEPPPIPA